MGSRGRAPTPTAILKLQGSWRAKAREKDSRESQPPKRRLACPRWLSEDARKVWRILVPQLVKSGLATIIDVNTLSRYCTVWVRWRKLEDFLKERGSTYAVRDEQGKLIGMRSFPQARMVDHLVEQLLRIEAQFGMTPSARTRINVDVEAEREDEFDRFLKNKTG